MRVGVKRVTALLLLSIGVLSTIIFCASIRPEEKAALFWYEVCSTGYYPFSTSICGVSVEPVSLPRKFNMSTILLHGGQEVITLHAHYFGIRLNPPTRILFHIRATAPINFQLVLVERDGADVHALVNEVSHFGRVVVDEQQITSLNSEFHVRDPGLYIFVFTAVKPKPIAAVTFEVN